MEASEIKHYSADQIGQLHKEIKSVIRPSSEPTPLKEIIESQKSTQDKRTRATNLFMKSLILAQEGKVELTQGKQIES